jgi:hypothetical protein
MLWIHYLCIERCQSMFQLLTLSTRSPYYDLEASKRPLKHLLSLHWLFSRLEEITEVPHSIKCRDVSVDVVHTKCFLVALERPHVHLLVKEQRRRFARTKLPQWKLMEIRRKN